ncbi:hypothetical protein L6164_007405 [Bauhinia variegata]|uniref:Uncharacterized protein n=1 Tax=Bauhinia variegata TaxID=167791 RepID=A0ACB9PDC6_BAUVA|nr:hypothetical protein L6164_007405 [Bauhinia variegata]
MTMRNVNDCNLYSREAIAGNDDLLAEILLRLPAKHLIRFKCVSKRWCFLISAPNFCRRHTVRHSNSVVSGFFLRRTPGRGPPDFEFVSLSGNHSSPFTSLDFVHDPAGIKILNSCNGLLLCSSFRKMGTPRKFYVFNPTTKQFLVLPDVGLENPATILGVNLAFDPSKSPNYRVICVCTTVESLYYYQIMIYSSENRAWRVSGSPFTAPNDTDFDKGVYWNGTIHWFSPFGGLLCFDVSQECLRKIPNIRNFSDYLGVSCGRLHRIEVYGRRNTQIKVFEMESDYSGWFLKHQVDVEELTVAYPDMVRMRSYAFILLGLVQDDSSLFLHIPGKVISYSFQDKTFEIKKSFELLPGQKLHFLQFGWYDAYEYIETLACV